MVELTDIDIKILKLVRKNEPVNVDFLKSNLPDIDSIEYRVQELASPDYRSAPYAKIPVSNSSYLVEEYETFTENHITNTRYLGMYRLTELGRKALQDYEQNERKHDRELWLKNAWIPIIVTLLTNLVISAAQWLWPLILQWFSSSP